MADEKIPCRICGNTAGNTIHAVREMMFGMRDVFHYLECGSCGCLQLLDVPQDMNRYYPGQYYSFEVPEAFTKIDSDDPVRRFLRRSRSAWLFEGKGVLGRFVARLNPPQPKLVQYMKLFKKCNAGLGSRILDVGSGRGKVLFELAWYGFRSLAGVDPYIASDIRTRDVAIYKRDIFAMDGAFDVVMFNHSFEHMDRPFEVLRKVRGLLSGSGMVLLRIPTVTSYAWEHYGVNWVGIDAPRHLFLYSLKAMEMLAAKTGYFVQDVMYDSNGSQFWSSEQYMRDIPLRGGRSYYEDPEHGIFTPQQIRDFDAQAEKLNAEHTGDQVCIFLGKNRGDG